MLGLMAYSSSSALVLNPSVSIIRYSWKAKVPGLLKHDALREIRGLHQGATVGDDVNYRVSRFQHTLACFRWELMGRRRSVIVLGLRFHGFFLAPEPCRSRWLITIVAR